MGCTDGGWVIHTYIYIYIHTYVDTYILVMEKTEELISMSGADRGWVSDLEGEEGLKALDG